MRGQSTPRVAARVCGGAARLVHVELGSAAHRAGLRPGDVVVRAGRRVVPGPEDLQLAVGQHPPGQPLELWVLRGSRTVKTLPTGLPDSEVP